MSVYMEPCPRIKFLTTRATVEEIGGVYLFAASSGGFILEHDLRLLGVYFFAVNNSGVDFYPELNIYYYIGSQ